MTDLDDEGYSAQELPPRLWELYQTYLSIDRKLTNGEIGYDDALEALDEAAVTDGAGRTWGINPDARVGDNDFWAVTRASGEQLSVFSLDDYVRTDDDSLLPDAAGFTGYQEDGDYPDSSNHITVDDQEAAQALEDQKYKDQYGEEPPRAALRIPKSMSNFKEFSADEKKRFLKFAGIFVGVLLVLIIGVTTMFSGGGGEEPKEKEAPKPPPSATAPATTEKPEPRFGGEIPESTTAGPDSTRVAQFIRTLTKGNKDALRPFMSKDLSIGDVYNAGLVAKTLTGAGYRIIDANASGDHNRTPTVLHLVSKERLPKLISVTKIGWVQEDGSWVATNVPTWVGKDNSALNAGK